MLPFKPLSRRLESSRKSRKLLSVPPEKLRSKREEMSRTNKPELLLSSSDSKLKLRTSLMLQPTRREKLLPLPQPLRPNESRRKRLSK